MYSVATVLSNQSNKPVLRLWFT